MGNVLYDPVTNTVLADVQIIPALAVAAGVYNCEGFTIQAPRGFLGTMNIHSGDHAVYEIGM